MIYMLLQDYEHLVIVLSSIRDYTPGENDIAILIVQKVCKQLKNVSEEFTTQDIYNEVVECFDFYNDFIIEREIDLKMITEDIYILVMDYLNTIVGEYNDAMG